MQTKPKPYRPDPDVIKQIADKFPDEIWEEGAASAVMAELGIGRSRARDLVIGSRTWLAMKGIEPTKRPDLAFTNREKRQLDAKRELSEAIQLAAENLKPVSIPKPPKYKPDRDAERLVLNWTDSHLGLIIRPHENAKSNDYSPDIALEYFEQYKKAVLSIARKKGSGIGDPLKGFDGVDLDILGDVPDGDGSIYPGQLWRVDRGALAQCILGAEMILELIFWLGGLFRMVRVHMRHGNHGRVGRRYEGKRPEDSWDRVTYELIRRTVAYTGAKNIEVDWEEADYAEFQIVNVFGWNFFMEHGDQVKSTVNTEVALRRRLRRMESDLAIRLPYGKFAHWHFFAIEHDIIVCGCWTGHSEYTLGQFDRPCPPVQLAYAVHPDFGVTWSNAINLKIPKKHWQKEIPQ